MNCLIVDDEPLARIGMERLIRQYSQLKLLGSFKNTAGIADFLKKNEVHLLFLDILIHFYNLLNHHKYKLNLITFQYYP